MIVVPMIMPPMIIAVTVVAARVIVAVTVIPATAPAAPAAAVPGRFRRRVERVGGEADRVAEWQRRCRSRSGKADPQSEQRQQKKFSHTLFSFPRSLVVALQVEAADGGSLAAAASGEH
jgi:hypothetical protein